MDGRIVVGWTESPESDAAVNWAAHQALLTSRQLILAYEIGVGFRPGGADDEPDDERIALATSRLQTVETGLTDRYPGLKSNCAVEAEDPASGLLRWSAEADILALGAPPRRHPRLLGALTDHLAAAADSPVALVPIGWSTPSHLSRSVVVGGSPSSAGRAAVHFAADEAVRMNCTLVVVAGGARTSDSGRQTLEAIQKVVAERPGLATEVNWVDDSPVDLLAAMSRTAQLLVVGAHHSADRWSIRLGPVTEEVLRRAECTVITVSRLRVHDRQVPAARSTG